MGRCVHKQKQKTRAPLYCKLSDMLSLNGEMGKSQDLPKRLSSPTPVSCSEESRESCDRQQSYATSGDGASVRVGYANTSDLVSDILEVA